MSTKVKKGLLKPVRYISKMFGDEKEPELQIGFPTDVKHVAHIGCEGADVLAPSWMKDYHSAPLSAAGTSMANEGAETGGMTWSSQDMSSYGNLADSPSRDGAAGGPESPTERAAAVRARRSNRSSAAGDGEAKERRRRKKDKDKDKDKDGTTDSPGIPKKSHRRAKGSSEGGSGRGSRQRESSAPAPEAVLEEPDEDGK